MTQLQLAGANSISAGYSASGMAFTLTASEAAAGTSASLAVSYALNDTVQLLVTLIKQLVLNQFKQLVQQQHLTVYLYLYHLQTTAHGMWT
jgi:hypothetical protein